MSFRRGAAGATAAPVRSSGKLRKVRSSAMDGSGSGTAPALTVKWVDCEGEHAPSPRQGHTATAVPRRECIVVFGGEGTSRPGSTASKVFYNDCHRFDCKNRSWSKLPCTGDIPSPRKDHTAAVLANTRLLIFGGVGDNGRSRLYDCYRLNLGTLVWEAIDFKGVLSSTRFQVRKSIAFAHFPDKIFLFGGAPNAEAELTLAGSGAVEGIVNAVADLDLRSLTVRSAAGSIPSPRSHYSCVSYAAQAILFGGFDGTRRFNDVHLFNPKSLQWTRQETTGRVPVGRYKHTACVYGQFMFVVGGYSVQWLNEVCILDLQTWRWFRPLNEEQLQQIQGAGGGAAGTGSTAAGSATALVFPRPRESHTTTAVGRFAYTFGGWSWPNCMNDVFRFNMSRMARLCVKIARLSSGKLSSKSHGKHRGSRRTSRGIASMARGQSSKKGAWRDGTGSTAGENIKAPSGACLSADEAASKAVVAAISPSFVLTAASLANDSGGETTPHVVDTILPKRAAFRSSQERAETKRNEYNAGGRRIARSNSNLLRADRKPSRSKLPNIRQLTSTSTDSDNDEDSINEATTFDEDNIDTSAVAASPPPARSSLSPMIRKASDRRLEFRARLSSGKGARLSSSPSSRLAHATTATTATTALDESQRRLIESEVGRHVESAVKHTRSQIETQEQRKQKAAAGIAALHEMLAVLNEETSQLTSVVAEEEAQAASSDAITAASAQEERATANEELRRRQLQASEERVQMLRMRLASATKSKANVIEATEDLEKRIMVVKGKLEKERQNGTKIDAASDDLGQDLQAMQDLVEQQKELRVALAEQLQTLRGSRSTLQRELTAQAEELKIAEEEEQELRDRVSFLVSRLAGPNMGRATEERPYETMEAGFFVAEKE